MTGPATDWTALFQGRPDLSPPGYEEAAKAATAATIEKQRLRAEAESAKRTAKSPPKAKKSRRR
jgi:hypothetical protein